MNSNSQIASGYKPKKILQGANLYLPHSVLVADLDVSFSAKTIDLGFFETAKKVLNSCRSAAAKRNIDSMPSLADTLTDYTLAEVLTYLALTIQRWCGLPVKFGKVLQNSNSIQVDRVVFECRLDHLATAAGQIAAEVCFHCINPELITMGKIEKMIMEFDRAFIIGRASQIPFIYQAEQKGIPWLPLTADGAILAFGQGSKLRKIHQTFTSNTSFIASKIATEKHTTANLLRAQGIPVPRQIVVTTSEGAIEASQSLGYPVAVKPARRDLGTAVFVDIQDETDVSKKAAGSLVAIAFNESTKHGPVLVEQLIFGELHRLMVINGKFRSARKQMPAYVTGDGSLSIKSLIEQANRTRFSNDWRPDEEAQSQLRKQDLNIDSIPTEGESVKLRPQVDGPPIQDVTSFIHPANVQLAERAAAIVNMDVAGLDFVTSDVSKPYWEVGAAFSEVNIPPGLVFDEEEIILDEWFPEGEQGRIVTIVLLDSPSQRNRGSKVAAQLQSKYSKVCLATKRGFLIDGELASPANFSSHRGLQAALCEPGVNAVVLEIDSDELVKNGLGVDCCDLSIFTAPQENDDQKLTLAARKILESISACVLDKSIVREAAWASPDAKKLAREINMNLR